MLDELLGTWLDKRKAKKELYKAYKMYSEKKKPYLNPTTIDIYEKIQNVQYAIAYVLCEYFNLKDKSELSISTYSIEWDICYDYKNHYSECKEAYEKYIQKNKQESMISIGKIVDVDNHNNHRSGDLLYCVEDNCTYYYYDDKNFIKMY